MKTKYIWWALGAIGIYWVYQKAQAQAQTNLNAATPPANGDYYLDNLPVYGTAATNFTGSILAGTGSLLTGVGNIFKNGFGFGANSQNSASTGLNAPSSSQLGGFDASGNPLLTVNSSTSNSTGGLTTVVGATDGINFNDGTDLNVDPTSFYGAPSFSSEDLG